jgi:hypothetical protein
MRITSTKASRLYSGLAASILLLASGASMAQSVVGLTAAPTSTVLPDGQSVPMWGYTCSVTATTATCAATNPNAGGSWSPVVITVPYAGPNTSLTINLTNNLSFGTSSIPTSLMIVGQVGGGLGGAPTRTASPTHAAQPVTWPVADPTTTNTPVAQLPRVQSFGTEVAAVAPVAGQTSPSTALTWSNLRPGTYLIESGTHPSIQAPMGLYGILVVTTPANANGITAPAFTYSACAGTPQPGCDSYDANLPVLLSEIDALQNTSVDAAVRTAGFSETQPWSGQPGMCGNPLSPNFNTCYPPTVNYSPRYYLLNGVSFDRTQLAAATASILAPATAGGPVASGTGNVLINFVNAGSHMHVPSVVGLPLTLVAEDGNPLPGRPRVQNEVFLSAGKTYDVLVKPTQSNGAYTAATYPIFDRALSLSTNNQRDGGMQAYFQVAGGAAAGAVGSAASGSTVSGVGAKTYYCAAGTTLAVTDPSKGVLAGTTGANGAALVGTPALPGTLSFQSNGTFSYSPPASGACGGTFAFNVNNGTSSYTATIAECDQNAQGANCKMGNAPVLNNDSYTATNAKFLSINSPGVLLNDVDPSGLPIKVDLAVPANVSSGLTLKLNPDGSFQATASVPGTYTFQYNVRNEQQTAGSLTGTTNGSPATVSLTFPPGSGLALTLIDDKHPTDSSFNVKDYRWIIEEDNTFWTDPKCQINASPRPSDSYGRPCAALPVESIGYNFHTSNMTVVAQGCVGNLSCEAGQTIQGTPTVCDIGNGVCRTDTTAAGYATQRVALTPDQVQLDPNKHYYISVLPGDAVNPTIAGAGGPVTGSNGLTRQFDPLQDCPTAAFFATDGSGTCGHNMGGHQIPPQFDANHNPVKPAVTIALAETPLPPAQIAVFVYEDDYPLNGENDAGGGVDILAPNEAGLGSFQIVLYDQGGQFGDANGQATYDMFNMPLSNSLAGTVDPSTKLNACPITSNPDGIVGMIVTCPEYESDGKTRSPLGGQAVIRNLYPGLYEPQAAPAADRIARGEEWLQTNTLDGGKPHEAFVRPGEPSYFQEFGPGGFHVQIGFANPKIINDRRSNSAGTGLCDPAPAGGGLVCNSSLSGQVHGDHMSRTPDERTYDTGSYDAFAFSHCYVSIGIPDQQDFAFAKCDAQGNFSFTGLPDGVFKMAVFDQWNDIMLDGLIAAVTVSGNTIVQPTVIQWRTNIYTRTYLDVNGNGIPDRDPATGADLEPGLGLLAMDVRYRDGSMGFQTQTDLNGYASNNEIFPYMNWLVVQPDTTRFKMTGIHVIYDGAGPDDCSAAAVAAAGGAYTPKCSHSAGHLAGTLERNSLPAALRIPGAVYCTDADCSAADGSESIKTGTYYAGKTGKSGPIPAGSNYLSTGRIDPPWMATEGWQGLLGQHNFIDFGMKPFKAASTTTVNGVTTALPAENGGVTGTVVYASTRPFDDPQLLFQNAWEPLVPNVQVNLYQETTNADGFTTLTLVDSTLTSSWDKWAQGFRTDGTGLAVRADGTIDPAHLLQNSDATTNPVTGASNNGYIPNMSCPGQDPTSPFFQTLQGSKMWLDTADVNGVKKTLAYDSQFKCFDGWSVMNQIQPAPYDGKYQFPSVTDRDPVTGHPSGTGHLNGAVTPVAGTNCTVCIANPDDGNPMLPAGKYVVEVVVPSGWELVKEEDKNILIGDIYIAPVTQQFTGLGNIFILPDQAAINAYYNANNAQNPTTNLGSVNVPLSDFAMNVDQVWPCAGQVRTVPDYLSLFPGVQQVAPFAGASRPLCDRKEVVLSDQMAATTKFFIYTKNPIAGKFTGVMTNDMASEFDPFSPQFGEKFGAPNLPVNMRDFMGTEMSRVYGDQWGVYNGMYFSTWEVNPPNPTGYAPQMSIACMNDPGPIPDPSGAIDPATNKVSMIVDPAYNPAYSNFCYEQMFMPGMTNYMDTPVTPVMAFADHYNLPDAEFPNGTPMVKRADYLNNGVTAAGSTNSTGNGPWSPSLTATLTITAVGDMAVQNPQYTGPSGAAAPYNAKTVIRHYGFGTQCTALSTACAAISGVTIGGVPATVQTWNDSTITVTLPNGAKVPTCMAQQHQAAQQCGEVLITAGNGKTSITGITATFGGPKPKLVTKSGPVTTTFGEFFPNPVQTAIDNAAPGDLLIVDAGAYSENLIMWKPVRLQGVGAASVIINGDAQPAGKMDPWRRRVDCLFGLTIQGWTNSGNGGFDAPGGFTCPTAMFFRSDRLPFEGFVGWDAASNGNLAQVLQEPSLMGAYEGAGVTVIGRGIRQPNASDLWGQGGGAGTYVDGSVYLTNSNRDCNSATTGATPNATDYGTGNFNCNPSGVDGVTVTNSSQGGGGIYLHGWNNNFQIANDRIVANAGTLSGGINIGNGESPPVATLDNTICGNTGANPTPLCPPIPRGTAVGAALPSALQTNVHVHHNQVIDNASIGDALFSGSPAGAGGITISAGSDNYEIDHNWVAANLTSSDGGGIAHMGVSFNGSIHNNAVLFNESNNPTLAVDGGGIIVMGAQQDRTLVNTGLECGGTQDLDCPPGIGDGTGPGLVIDSNLILGNSAGYGSGGGLSIRQVNGTEVEAFPAQPNRWYGITVTNNIIANNVAGWDGGGVSIQDSFKTTVVNNTIVANDTTASAGVLFKTLGAIDQASPPPGCLPTPDPSQPQNPGCLDPNAPHIPQPAGLVTMQNTPNMTAGLTGYFSDEVGAVVQTGAVICPAGFGYGDAADSLKSRTNGRCILVSLPKLANDMFWQNRAFHVEMVDQNGVPLANQGSSTPNGTGLQSQQNIIALLPEFSQTQTGQCVDPNGMKNSDGSPLQLYWDVGVRMDTLPNVNGHALVFNAATVSTSYNLEGFASVTAVFQVSGVSVVSGGAGYVVGDVVNFAAAPNATGSGAVGAVSAVDANGAITAINVTGPGGQYSLPPIIRVTSANGMGALLNATLNAGTLTGVVITEAGGTYTSAPTVTIDPPPAGGTQATATATETNGRLTSITLINKGSGYTTVPNLVLSGGGIQPNAADNGAVGLTATNSIFSDALNAANVFGSNNVVPTAPAGGAGLLVGQYCNGARVPPEQCSSQQGANNQGMCLGYFTPAGISENVGVPQVFRFQGIAATATVDEGNNWINMTYGPLTLSRPTAAVTTVPTAPEQMLAVAAVGSTQGAYSIAPTSVAVNKGSNSVAPNHDFFGNTRPLTNANPADIGAVEVAVPNVPLPSVTPASLAFGNVVEGATAASQDLTLSNNGAASFTGITIAVTSPFSRITTGTFPGGAPNCAAALAAGASCTIKVAYTAPATAGASTGTVTITGNATVANSPVQLTGTSIAGTHTASISPNSLAFGTWATGTTSTAQSLTVTNTGTTALAGGTFTFGGATPQPFSRLTTGTFPAGAPNCGAGLAVGASCTIKVVFAAPTATAFSRTLTVGYTGATVTPAAVTLTGTGTAPATVSISPLTVTLPTGSSTGTGTVTLTNTAAAGGASVQVTNVAVSGGTLLTYVFTNGPLAGPDTCTGATVAPGASCSVSVRFTNLRSARGANRTGTITFTDSATGSPQSSALIGFATP